MNRSVLAAPLVVAAVVGAFVVGGGHLTKAAVAADTPSSTNGVVVDGLGKVTGTPDVLRATLGVSVHRSELSTALQDANTLQNRIRAALKKGGSRLRTCRPPT
ncbi:MAG: hypothetical protein JWM02_108 [Frankiales bacterium]|nr:hypothetical protein [Frankiales bacterium]